MIQIFTTGGTIEGLEYDKVDSAPMKAPITIAQHLSQISHSPDYTTKELFSKDSRFITEQDRELLFREIQLAKTDKILVTHGTWTMVETAQFIGRHNLSKSIVFTGAFILGNLPNTDARMNLSFALKELEKAGAGTFIAMQNTLFDYEDVVKNPLKNRFEKIKKQL
jgi:L-asparaginase